jgi:hypothetical protein
MGAMSNVDVEVVFFRNMSIQEGKGRNVIGSEMLRAMAKIHSTQHAYIREALMLDTATMIRA